MKNLNFKPAPRILLDDKIEFFAKGINEMCVQGIFSIASFEKCKIKISGDCQYQLRTSIELLAMSSRCLSNYGKGVIKTKASSAIALFRN